MPHVLARMGDDESAEEADAKTEEADANSGESDWYPYDDPAFDNASFEDEEAYLAARNSAATAACLYWLRPCADQVTPSPDGGRGRPRSGAPHAPSPCAKRYNPPQVYR